MAGELSCFPSSATLGGMVVLLFVTYVGNSRVRSTSAVLLSDALFIDRERVQHTLSRSVIGQKDGDT